VDSLRPRNCVLGGGPNPHGKGQFWACLRACLWSVCSALFTCGSSYAASRCQYCAKSADLLQSSCSSCLYVAVLHVDSAGEETQPEDTAQQQQQQQTKPKISATNDDTSRHPDACQCSMCFYLSTPAIVAAWVDSVCVCKPVCLFVRAVKGNLQICKLWLFLVSTELERAFDHCCSKTAKLV